METKLQNNFKMLIGTVKNYIKIKNLFPFRSLVKTHSSEEFWANSFFFKLHYKSIVDYSVMTRTLDRKESKKQHGQ